jgi:hypothetical protein
MSGVRVSFEELQLISRLKRPASVVRWLLQEGIAYSLDARSLPWTTVPAIDRCLRRRSELARYPYADIALEF